MKDHHRQPLRPVSANAPTPPRAPALNRLENMAIGGKAGLKLRRAGGAGGGRRHSGASGGAGAGQAAQPEAVGACTPLSRSGSDNSTFALSTDVSTASAHPADGAAPSQPRARRVDSPLCSPPTAKSPPEVRRGARADRPTGGPLPRESPHRFVSVFDDQARRSPAQPPAGGHADGGAAGRKAVPGTSGCVGADVQAATKPAVETGAVDESADLDEEEMQECLRQLERQKAARAQAKQAQADVAREQGKAVSQRANQPLQTQAPVAAVEEHDTCAPSGDHGAVDGHVKHVVPHVDQAPAAPQQQALQGRAPDEKPQRKFRVLPAVITPVTIAPKLSAAASPTGPNAPRILEVKVVTPPDSRGPLTSHADGQSQQNPDETLSPFSAFYRETAGARQDAAVPRDNAHAALDAGEGAQGALSPSPASGAGDRSGQAEKSVHFAAAPLCAPADGEEDAGDSRNPAHANNREMLSPASGSSATQEPSPPESPMLDSGASSREVSLAPKTQRLWPFQAQAPQGSDKLEPCTRLDAQLPREMGHVATRQGSLLSVGRGGAQLGEATEMPKAGSAPASPLPSGSDRAGTSMTRDTSMARPCADTSMPACSPKANSWSGLGVKLVPIRAASLRSRDQALVGGLEIVNMEVGGPAERAGMHVGDVVMYLSNGVLAKGTSAMEATSLLRQQTGTYHVIVSRRRSSWGQHAKAGHWQRQAGTESTRRIVAVLMQPGASNCDVAFGTDLSLGFTLRDGKDGPDAWASLPMVSDLIDGSAAHTSGLRIGDVIVGIGSLQVSKVPARACVSLLQGEAGSQVLLGIYHASAGISMCDGTAAGTATALDLVQWQLVERSSTFHVSLETSQQIAHKGAASKGADHDATLAACSLPELSPDNSNSSNHNFVPSPAPGLMPTAQESGQEQDLPHLSLPSADVSAETYFAYRETADNSALDSPGPHEEAGCGADDDKSLLELRQLSARAHAQHGGQQVGGVRRRARQSPDCKTRGGELDKSLVELRRHARAREKRQAFLSAEAQLSQEHENGSTHAPPGAAKLHEVAGVNAGARDAKRENHALAHGKRSKNCVLPPAAETAAASAEATPVVPCAQGATHDRRFAMMRTMLRQHDDDDSLLDFMQQTEAAAAAAQPRHVPAHDAPRHDASAPTVACEGHGRAGPARKAAGDGVRHEPRPAAAARRKQAADKDAYRRSTPPKPVTPNVKVLGGAELERAAWMYVHQHEMRSQVSATHMHSHVCARKSRPRTCTRTFAQVLDKLESAIVCVGRRE